MSRFNFFLYFVQNQDKYDIQELIDDNIFYQQSFENLRNEDNKHKIKDEYKFPVLFMQCFLSEYAEIINELDLTDEQKSNLAYSMFTKHIPKSFYVQMFLIYQSKLKNHQRKNDINDYKDIISIAQALPYCDLIITEKYWSSIIIENGLDKEYNTIVSKNLDDLKKLF